MSDLLFFILFFLPIIFLIGISFHDSLKQLEKSKEIEKNINKEIEQKFGISSNKQILDAQIKSSNLAYNFYKITDVCKDKNIMFNENFYPVWIEINNDIIFVFEGISFYIKTNIPILEGNLEDGRIIIPPCIMYKPVSDVDKGFLEKIFGTTIETLQKSFFKEQH